MFNPPYYFYLFKDVLNGGIAGGFGDTKERAISFIIQENEELEKELNITQKC